jgi:HD superfamily phosphohydrolase
LLAWQQEPPLQENKRVPHEVMSCLFFAHAWHEMFEGGEPDIPRLVAGALLGEPLFGAAAGHELESWLPFIHDMVASAPADADRMDYLVRDTTSIGVNYGLFDRNRLLKSFLCYRGTAGGLDAHSTYRLGLKRSGIRAVENLVQARFELFVQVYYHKTNRAIELMLRQVAALSSSTSFINWPDLDTVIQQYCDLDDHEFLRRLSRHDSRGIHHLVERIRGRRLWKRLADISVVRDDNGLVSKNKTRTSADILRGQVEKEVPGAEIQVDVIDPKATKDLAKGAALLDRHRSEVYTATDTVSWTDSSAIIRTLGEEEKAIARLYTSTEDSALLDRMRETVRGMRGTDGVAA